jgi:hypothetical protein
MEITKIVDDSGKTIMFVPTSAVVVVKSDTTVLVPGLLFCGVGGHVNIVPADGFAPVIFKNIPDGTFLPVLVKMVYSTSTTATDMVICR